MAIKKGLLPLTGIAADKMFAGVLGTATRIASQFIPKRFSDRIAGVAGISANLLDALLIDPLGRADILILIHPDHPFSPGYTFHLLDLCYQKRFSGGSILYCPNTPRGVIFVLSKSTTAHTPFFAES